MEYKNSQVTVIVGPMKSGKSKKLFSILDWLEHKTIPIKIFKPNIDTRDVENIATRYLDQKIVSINIDSDKPEDMYKHLDLENIKLPFCIIIDEAQFFNKSIVTVVKELVSRGYSFFIAGLDLDAKSNTFGPMGELLAFADHIKKVCSVCEICKETATKTTLVSESDEFDENNIVIEKKDFYLVICNECLYKRAK